MHVGIEWNVWRRLAAEGVENGTNVSEKEQNWDNANDKTESKWKPSWTTKGCVEEGPIEHNRLPQDPISKSLAISSIPTISIGKK